MIEINLLPVREARRAQDVRQQVMQLLLMLLVVGGAIGVVNSRLGDEIDMANARVVQMQRDIDQFKPQLEQVAAFKKRKGILEKKIDVIEGLDQARSGPVRMLNELATRTPARLWLTSVKTQGQTITMQGSSLDNELVALFLRGLGDSPYFDQVDLDSTQLTDDKNGLRVVKFNIRAVLVNPGPAALSAAG